MHRSWVNSLVETSQIQTTSPALWQPPWPLPVIPAPLPRGDHCGHSCFYQLILPAFELHYASTCTVFMCSCKWVLLLSIIFVKFVRIYLPVVGSFTLLYTIPLYNYTVICLSFLLLADICVVSSLRLWQIMLLWTFVFLPFGAMCIHICLGYADRIL